MSRKIKYVPSCSRRSNSRRISEIAIEEIIFTDGGKITFDHVPNCCEYNYADFEQLDDLARNYTFEGEMKFYSVEGGFTFGDSRRQFFVPCYSDQNGYYTQDIDIYWNGVCVLSLEAELVE